jgi:hypothetical protein
MIGQSFTNEFESTESSDRPRLFGWEARDRYDDVFDSLDGDDEEEYEDDEEEDEDYDEDDEDDEDDDEEEDEEEDD